MPLPAENPYMAEWVKIADVDACPPGTGLECIVGPRIIALFHVAGAYYALDGICPHQGGPLARGLVQGTTVTCPWHGWQFCVTTGAHRNSPAICQRQWPTKVENHEVWIDLSAESGSTDIPTDNDL